MHLKESSELYKGIFWVVDLDNISNNKNYCFTIPSDYNGNTIGISDYEINAKSGNTYNHEKLWSELPAAMTHNKKYNYYPRGRVVIANSKATVYLNPNINTEEVQKFIIDEFNLTHHNNINKIIFISDGSDHYKCFLDN